MRAAFWKLSAAVISLAACGSEHDAPGPAPDEVDAAVVDPAAPDATTDPGPGPGPSKRCDPTKPFGTPVPARGINDPTSLDTNAALSGDERTVVFARKVGAATEYLAIATRASADADWGQPTKVAPDADHRQYQPFLSRDGRTLIYSAQFTGRRDGDSYLAAWSDATASFGKGSPVTNLSRNTVDEGTAFLTASGQTLYTTSNSAGWFDIYRSEKQPSGEFGTPRPVDELNTIDDKESAAVLSDDGREVFFASDRKPGAGLYDVWHATRPSPATAFTEIQNVTELNGDLDDKPSWLSADGCVLYLTKGGDIYVATRGR